MEASVVVWVCWRHMDPVEAMIHLVGGRLVQGYRGGPEGRSEGLPLQSPRPVQAEVGPQESPQLALDIRARVMQASMPARLISCPAHLGSRSFSSTTSIRLPPLRVVRTLL